MPRVELDVRIIAFSALLVGCSVSLGEFPGAAVTCATDAECPAGTECRLDVGRCVQVGGDDELGPEITAVTLDPESAGLGDVVRLHFTVSEALAAEPSVFLDGTGHEFFLETTTSDPVSGRYVYRYVVSHATAEGLHPVSVSAVDRFGNATDAAVAELSVDYSPPGGDLTWLLAAGQSRLPLTSPSAFNLETETGASVSSLEVVRASEVLVLDPGAILGPPVVNPGDATRSNRAGSLAPADLGVVDGETFYLRARLVDAAGNSSAPDAIRTASILADGTPPFDVSVTYLGATPAQSRDVAVLVSAGGGSELRIDGDILTAVDWSSAVFPASRLLTLSEGAGAKEIRATVRDEAGNVGPVASTFIVYVLATDTEGPLLLSASAPAARQVELTFDEPLDPDSVLDPTQYEVEKLPGGVIDTPDPAVLSVQLSVDQQSVTLFVDRDSIGQDAYTAYATGVRDALGQLQDPNPASASFLGFGTAPDPSPPDLLSPPTLQHWTDNTPTLSWTARASATAYTLEYSTDPTFATGTITATVQAPATSRTITSPLAPRTYHWRVRSDVPPLEWAVSSFEIVNTQLFVSGTTSTCAPCFGNRDKPYATISEALEVATGLGVVAVRVHGGQAYQELVTLRPGVDLLGGYDATWTTSNRNLYPTTLQPGASDAVVVAAIGITDSTRFGGFEVEASAALDAVGMLVVGSTDVLTITDSAFTVADNDAASAGDPAGVTIAGSGSAPLSGPVLRDCTLRGGERSVQLGGAARSSALIVSNAAPWVDRNIIIAGPADGDAVGVSVRGTGSPVLTNNLVLAYPPGAGDSCIAVDIQGVYPEGNEAILTNNTLAVPACLSQVDVSEGRALRFHFAHVYATNNLFVSSDIGTDPDAPCVESVSTVIEPEVFNHNGFIGCGNCWYLDTSTCLSDAGFTAAAIGAQSVSQNQEAAPAITFVDAAFTNPRSDSYNFRLDAGSATTLRTGGANTGLGGDCGGVTCGNVERDLLDALRTVGYSRGAYEF